MTRLEYQRVRELIENRFRQDMAALERVWFTIHGVNAPDSPIAMDKPKPEDAAQEVPADTSPSEMAGALTPGKRRRKPWSPEARARQSKRARERFEEYRKEKK